MPPSRSGNNPLSGSVANHDNHLQACRRVRQRLPCRRTSRALGEVSRPRVPCARQAGAVATRRRDELVSQDQRRSRARHDEPQPAAPRDLAPGHDLGRGRRTRCERAPSDERGRMEPARAARGHGCDGHRPGVPVPDLVRRGLPPRRRIPTPPYALARAYNDWIADFCQRRSAPAVRRRDAAAAGHGLHAGGTAPCRRHPLLPRRIHPSDVLPGPLLHQPVLRSAMGGARTSRPGGRGAPDAGPVEPGMDVARPVRREGQEPVRPDAVAGWRRRSVLGRRRRPAQHLVLHRLPPTRASDGADPVLLARQSHVRCLGADRLHRDAALSRR